MLYSPGNPDRRLAVAIEFGIALLCLALLLSAPRSAKPGPADLPPPPNPDPCWSQHLIGGPPSVDNAICDHAYAFGFDRIKRMPSWVAWKVDASSLYRLDRISPVRSFHVDKRFIRRLSPDDFNGIFYDHLQGYARAHVMPFWAAAQDRGEPGKFAFRDLNHDGAITQEDADATGKLIPLDHVDLANVRAANSMSNVLPMHQNGFNNNPAAWHAIEAYEKNILAAQHQLDFYVIAGPVWGQKPVHMTDTANPFPIPHAFFRIVILANYPEGSSPPVLAFLIPHTRTPRPDPSHYLVSIATVEAATGLSFFASLDVPNRLMFHRADTYLQLSRFPEPPWLSSPFERITR